MLLLLSSVTTRDSDSDGDGDGHATRLVLVPDRAVAPSARKRHHFLISFMLVVIVNADF